MATRQRTQWGLIKMPDIDPLTAEEIVFIRRMYQIRQKVSLAFWGFIGVAAAGAIIAALQ